MSIIDKLTKKDNDNKPMTLEQYIDNPGGKNNAANPAMLRNSLMNLYRNKFDNILLRENGKIRHYLYKDTKNNVFYILVKVPSEIIPDFYYDVVFKFYTDAGVEDAGRSLKKYYIQFFSNDPAFVYTYAYVFIQKDLFVTELMPKMTMQAARQEPTEKNPNQVVNYVKSLMFAYLFMEDRKLLNLSAFKDAEEFTLNTLLSEVEDAEDKIADRQREDKNVSHRKKLVATDKNVIRAIKKYGIGTEDNSRLVVATKKAKGIKKVSAVNSIKTTRKTRRR